MPVDRRHLDAEYERLLRDPLLAAGVEAACRDLEEGRVSGPMTAAQLSAELDRLAQHKGWRRGNR